MMTQTNATKEIDVLQAKEDGLRARIDLTDVLSGRRAATASSSLFSTSSWIARPQSKNTRIAGVRLGGRQPWLSSSYA